jgi:hypothetical protein
VLDRLERWQFVPGCLVGTELIGDDPLWHELEISEERLKKVFGSLCISVILKQNVQHGSVFVNRSPQPLNMPANQEMHLVQVPATMPPSANSP